MKTNKTSTKGPRHKKLEIKRIIAEVEIPTTNRKNYNFFWWKENKEKRREKSTGTKLYHHWWHTPHQQEKGMMTIPTRHWKGMMTYTVRKVLMLPTSLQVPHNYTHIFCFFLFSQIQNCPWAYFIITKKT